MHLLLLLNSYFHGIDMTMIVNDWELFRMAMLVAFRDNAELLLGADTDKMVPFAKSNMSVLYNILLKIL